LKEVIHLLNNAKQPLILAGVEVGRIKMQDELLKLTEKMQIPIASTLLGKSVVSESHNLSLGTFFGNLSNERAKNYLQKSDCVLCLGAILSDVNLGMFTYEFDRNTLIESRIESLKVKHHEYTGITLEKLINGLLTDQTLKKHNIKLPKRVDAFEGLTIEKSKIKTQHVEILLNQFLNRSNSPTYRIVCDVGDCLFIGQGLHLNNISCFLSPAYYLSMGFAVPGGIGAQIAEPEKRPLILVGDGAFQMTGLELISATRLNLNPVVILLNNGSYATLENVELDSIPGSYAIGKYDYYKMAEIFGGIGLKCETTNAFELALKDIEGKYKDKMVIIQVDLEPDDCTEVLSSFGERMGKSNKDASQNS
ncbi:MAG TPA: thiamine pyrophosphate-dependent enzyme, partial [Vampirovibrionales bacterium]